MKEKIESLLRILELKRIRAQNTRQELKSSHVKGGTYVEGTAYVNGQLYILEDTINHLKEMLK